MHIVNADAVQNLLDAIYVLQVRRIFSSVRHSLARADRNAPLTIVKKKGSKAANVTLRVSISKPYTSTQRANIHRSRPSFQPP